MPRRSSRVRRWQSASHPLLEDLHRTRRERSEDRPVLHDGRARVSAVPHAHRVEYDGKRAAASVEERVPDPSGGVFDLLQQARPRVRTPCIRCGNRIVKR